jgi:HSP20 family molecular chaperone IbpA
MNVTHPNYGQNYRLTRAVLRLGEFTVSELEDLTGAAKNTVYSFVSKLRNVDEGFLEAKELQSLRGRPQKRFSLTDSGTKYLSELSFEMASRFGEDTEPSPQSRARSRGPSVGTGAIALPSDIYEEEQEMLFQVDVPGMAEEDLDVRIERNDLIVSGERPAMPARVGATPYMIERRHGHFVRTYPLPERVEARITNIKVRNGVLEVILRKAAASDAVVARATDTTARSEKIARVAYHHLKESAE